MSARDATLLERSPLAGTPDAGRGWRAPDNRLALSVETGLFVALVTVARGELARVSVEADALLGAPLPADRSAAFNGPVTIVAAGRGTYLLVRKGEIDGAASTWIAGGGDRKYSGVECSDQFVFFALEGPRSPRVLGALCSLDFDPGVFRAGAAAVTRLQDVRAYIWRTPDMHRYMIGVQRSLALHVWQELLDACKSRAEDP